jgi:hypothetical protein
MQDPLQRWNYSTIRKRMSRYMRSDLGLQKTWNKAIGSGPPYSGPIAVNAQACTTRSTICFQVDEERAKAALDFLMKGFIEPAGRSANMIASVRRRFTFGMRASRRGKRGSVTQRKSVFIVAPASRALISQVNVPSIT